MYRKRKQKSIIIICLLMVLTLMSIGYAAFQTKVKVKGTTRITSLWDVRITNVTAGTATGGAENKTTPTWDGLTANMEANLYEPGDAMEYDVTITNNGTIDAVLSDVIGTPSNNDAVIITFSGYAKGEKLYKSGQQGNTKTIHVKIEYNPAYTGGETSGQASVEFTYTQGEGGEVQPTGEQYLLTYDYSENGGTSTTTHNEYVNSGSTVTISGTASKMGWTFVGWNTNKDATTGLSTIVMDSNKTLYAIYRKEAVTLTAKWNANNATLSSTSNLTCTISAVYNKQTQGTSCEVTAPTITAPANTPTVLGFNTSSDSNSNNEAYNASNGKLTLTSNSDNKTWYAQTTKEKVTLTAKFNANGATLSSTANKTCDLAATFNGAAQATSCTVDAPTITAPANTPTVLGFNTGADSNSNSEAYNTSNGKLTLTSSNNNSTWYAQTTKSKVTLTAKWNANNATLSSTTNKTCDLGATFNGAAQATSCTVEAPTITAPANTPTILGFNTAASSNANNAAYSTDTGELTLTSSLDNKTWYAQTTKAKVNRTITFYRNSNTSFTYNGTTYTGTSKAFTVCSIAATFNGTAQATSCTVASITMATIAAPEATPTIIGWSTGASTRTATYTSGQELTNLEMPANKKLYAQSTKAKVTLTAKFNANGATLSSTANQTCDLAAVYNGAAQATSCTVDAPTITRDGYDIIGYNTAAGSTTNNASYDASTGKITLTSSNNNTTWYAVTKNQTAFTASWNANGATLSSTTALSCNIYNTQTSCTVDAPTITRSGYDIIGFNTSASSTTNNTNYNTSTKKLTLSGSGTWYAVTKNQTAFTASWNANGATLSSTASKSCNIYNTATTCTVDAPTITRSGYDIIGYNTSASSTTNNTNYNASTGKLTLSASGTWYAVTKNSTAFTASWNANGATLSSTTAQSCNTYNTATTCTVDAPTITRSGYDIIGFNTSASSTTNNTNYNTSTKKLTLSGSGTWYAVTKNSTAFTASWNANGATLSSTTAQSCSTYNTQTSCTVTAPTITAPENTPTVLGWNTAAGSNANNSAYNTSTKALTLSASGTWYAQTTKAKVTLTAKWNANGATLSSTADQTCDLAATFNGAAQATSCEITAPTITAPTNTPTITGYSVAAGTHSNNAAYDKTTGILTLTSSLDNKTWYAQTTKAKVNRTITFYRNSNTSFTYSGTTYTDTSKAFTVCSIAATYNGVAQATSCTVASITMATIAAPEATPTIIGWSTGASTRTATYTSGQELTNLEMTANKKLYAQSTKAKVTLTAKFNANGATLSSTANQTCDLAAVYNGAAQATSCTVDAPTITRSGYDIIGYNTTAGATTNNASYDTSTGKITLTSSNNNTTWYAVTKNSTAFTASWNANGATLSSTTALSCNTYNTATTCTVDAPTITRSGYTIVGYNTAASSTTNNSAYNKSTKKLTLSGSGTWYAVTKNNTAFTATWNANNATLSSTTAQSCNTYNTQTTCTVTAPTITGPTNTPTVLGWNTAAGSNANNSAYNTSTKALTLSASGTWYAQTTKAKVTLTAKWNANNNTLSSTANKTCDLAATFNGTAQATSCTVDAPTITAPANTPTIVGFNTSASSTANNSSYNTSTKKLTLTSSNNNSTWYAITTKAKVTLTAKWNANGATLSSTANKTCDLAAVYNGTAQATSCTVDAPTITRDGYTIIGFNTTAGSTTNNASYNTSTKKLTLTSSNNNTTWYAVTKNSTAFTATWNANNATLSSTTAQSCNTYNTQTTCTVTAPTITGPTNTPTVLGWNTAAGSNANNSAYNTSTKALTLSASGTWYAQTTKAKVTLTAKWNANNATLSSTASKTCDLAATFNGTAQATSCTVDAPTITAPSNTPTILGFNTAASSNANNSAYSTSTKKLTLTSSLNNKTWYAQTTKAKVDRTITFYRNSNTSFTYSGTTYTDTSKAFTVCSIAATYNGTAQATSCTVASITMATITAPSATPTIIGWSTGASTRTATYTSGEALTNLEMTANKTLYAQTTKAKVTLTAKWNANGATLSSTANKTCDLAATYNGTAQATSCTVDAPTITRDGYTIIGYNTTAGATTNNSAYSSSTGKVTMTSSLNNTTWYAVTKNNTAFTASWNANGATLSSTTAQSCNTYNTATTCQVTAPTITRSGYTIVGYNTSAGATTNNTNYNTSTKKLTLSASGTWYAVTKNNTAFTATWNANNATLSSTTAQSCNTYNTATTCTVTAPTITGPTNTPTVLGWNTAAGSNANNSAYNTSTKALTLSASGTWYAQTTKAKVTLTAKWNANNNTLSSTANKTCDLAATFNGTAQATSCTVDAPTITAPANTPTIVGFNTSASSTANNSSYNTSTKKLTLTSSNNNSTWYAITTKAKVTLTAKWNANGATLSSTANKTCDLAAVYNGTAQATTCTVDAPTITRSGYTIIGYNTTAGATTNNTNYNTSTKKLTLSASGTWYAVTKNSTAFTATWNANNATLSSTTAQSCNTYNTQTTCTVTAPTITGPTNTPTVLGWNTAAGSNANNSAYNTSTKALTLSASGTWYAQTTKAKVTLTAKWNANNNTLSSTANKTCDLAATFNGTAQATSCTVDAPTITAPTNTPTIVGFNTSASSTANNSSYNTSTKKLTLTSSNNNSTWYAITTKAKVTLTANWNANGATLSSTAAKTCDLAATYNGTAQATSCTVDAPTITRSGFTITGFNTTASATANNTNYNTSTKKLTLSASGTWYAITSKVVTITFAKGSNTSAIGSTSGTCTIRNSATNCTIATPTITSNSGFLSVGWSTTNGATTGTKAGANITVSDNTTYYGNCANGTPTFSETSEGTITITYPLGCSAPYSCKYKFGSNAEGSTTSQNYTADVGSDMTISATASDGSNTASSTYTLIRSNLYVKTDGSDTSGFGTIAKPYASITKAYNSATSTRQATVYVMDNITHSDTTTMSSNKNIVITSCTKQSNTSCPYSTVNSVTKATANTANMVALSNGNLTLSKIKFDGNQVASTAAMFNVAGTLTMNTDTTLTKGKNTADTNGSAVYVASTGTFTISGGTISSNSSASAIYNLGTLNISGGDFSSNSSDDFGGVIGNFGSLTISSGNFLSNSATNYGGAIYSGVSGSSAGTLTMTGGTIKNNTSGNNGGGIAISANAGKTTLSGMTITENTATNNGGGIVMSSGSTMDLKGGTISKNTVTTYGGGGIYSAGTLNMSSGTISENHADSQNGGGIASTTGSTLNITGGTISGNTATNSGGIICYSATCTVNGSTAKIQNNTAESYAGGIGISGTSTFDFKSGTVSGNTVTTYHGGGITVGGSATLNITGGTISNNTAKVNGGGIYSTGTSNISSATIDNNTSQYGAGLYNGDANAVMTINSGTISNNDCSASGGGIHVGSGTVNIKGGTITSNTSGTGGGAIRNNGTVNFSGGTITSNSAPNGGGISNGSTFNMTGGSIIKNTATTANGGGILSSGTFTMSNGTIGGSAANKNTAKTYGGGIASTGPLNISQPSGKTTVISYNTSGTFAGGIYFSSNTFTFTGGTISYNTSTTGGGGIFVANNSASLLKMSGGTVSNNSGTAGGGIYCDDSGKINMTGGTVQANHATTSYGGGILSDGTLTMSAGTVKQNHSDKGFGGGIAITSTGSFTMSGTARVEQNYAQAGSENQYGGGVSCYGTCNLNAGTIISNQANSGGGFIVGSTGNGTINGVTIESNTANSQAGGVFVSTGGVLTFKSGTIKSNTCTSSYYAGGIKCNGTCTMSGGSVTGNSIPNGQGGGIHIGEAGNFTLTGGSITNNSAANRGGIYKTAKGRYNVSGSPSCSGNGQSDLTTSCRLT